jgi:acyl carrier protein
MMEPSTVTPAEPANISSAEPANIAPAETALEREIAKLIVAALNLEILPEQITAEEPLYGDPLGLDSIDILEIALVLANHYGVQIKADGEDNFKIFASLRALSTYIREHRTK